MAAPKDVRQFSISGHYAVDMARRAYMDLDRAVDQAMASGDEVALKWIINAGVAGRAGAGPPTTPSNESILQEAQRLVHGDRGNNYGHPFDDFGRTAGMVSALLQHKLREPLTQEDVAMMMVCVKLSREANRPKRDNRVDVAGYAEALDMVIAERTRREGGPENVA